MIDIIYCKFADFVGKLQLAAAVFCKARRHWPGCQHSAMADVQTTVRHRTDDTATPVLHQCDCDGGAAEATVCRKKDSKRARRKIRYNGAFGYYICYSIFVAVVGLILLCVLLMMHLSRCVFLATNTSVYECFINLQLGHARRHPSH